MQYVLHITQRCNFACDYCSACKGEAEMEAATAYRVADMALENALKNNEATTCISFYGGEPLLRKGFIYDVITYCEGISSGTAVEFHYRMTTNASLIDDGFLQFFKMHGIKLALSIDGMRCAHDAHRRDTAGKPTFDAVLAACKAVLAIDAQTPAMLTINPDTAGSLMESVCFLYDTGFTTICTTPNYCGQWRDADLSRLGSQYRQLAGWYGVKLLSGEGIKLPLFDSKLVNTLLPVIDENKCVPGAQRVSIAPDGTLYPCSHFVHFPNYAFGNVCTQLDGAKLAAIREEAAEEMPDCLGCALRSRCDNKCGCKNLATTGCVNRVDPLVCAHERMLISITDELGRNLFAGQ